MPITDADLSPAPELVDAYIRLGRADEARTLAAEFSAAAEAKAQPWALARALRSAALVSDDDRFGSHFDGALERLDACPWADRARGELQATGETLRRRDPTTVDELTPQELQIPLLLAARKTTREAAAALFLSPKTIEYHLRHVYQKLGSHSREELARAVGERPPGSSAPHAAVPA